jgi:hypothetical protein
MQCKSRVASPRPRRHRRGGTVIKGICLAFAVLATSLVAFEGCGSSTPPLGPDIVVCNCSCQTESIAGEVGSANTCGNPNFCDPPCPSDYVCSNTMGCVPTCTSPTGQNGVETHTQQQLAICTDSSDVSNTVQACENRCQANNQASLQDCAAGILQALGLSSLENTISNDSEGIFPSTTTIEQECGSYLFNKFIGGTCELSNSGISALTGLLFCIWSPLSPLNFDSIGTSSFQTCENTSPNGVLYTVQQIHGCPQFLPSAGDAGVAGAPTAPPIGGEPTGALSTISVDSSTISVSGSKVDSATTQPSGLASTGRIGPILMLSQLQVSIPDTQITVSGHGTSLSGGFMTLQKPVTGVISAGNNFTIAAGAVNAIVTGSVDNKQTSVNASNDSPLNGVYDEVNRVFALSGAVELQSISATLQFQLNFNFVKQPPIANAGPDQTVECTVNTNRTGIVQLSAGQSFEPDPTDAITGYAWSAGRALVSQGTSPDATTNLGLGETIVTLTTVDTHNLFSRDTAIITVVDTHPPVFPPLPLVVDSVCDPTSQAAALPTPHVTDACSPVVTVTGVVISSNGVALASPIPITNGVAQLVPGNYVVEWTAVDESQNVATATQAVTVRPGIEATDEITIDLGASVVQGSNGFAALGNQGSDQVFVGFGAQTGSILAQGPVFLDIDSTVHGSVLSASTVFQQPQSMVTGTVAPNTTVPLPAGPNLSGVTFPTPSNRIVNVLPNRTTTLAPGSYGLVVVPSGSTLVLTTGTYFIQNLNLAPLSTMNLDQATGPVQLYITNTFLDQGQIVPATGLASSFLLGYTSTLPLNIQAPFPGGTVIAPKAHVLIAQPGSESFTGELFAQGIDVAPNATVICSPTGL